MRVRKYGRLLRENRDMYTVMVGKIIRLPRELATQFSRHILSNGFVQSFDISVVFQNSQYSMFCLSCHVLIIHTCIELQAFTQHLYRNVSTVVTRTVSKPYELTNLSAQSDRSNVQLTSHNFANRQLILHLSDMFVQLAELM